VLGYALGLLASLWLDLPSGSMIVCTIVASGLLIAWLSRPPRAS
jgi:ABC-type Mn2+/Zn2+ transport system permease subunit